MLGCCASGWRWAGRAGRFARPERWVLGRGRGEREWAERRGKWVGPWFGLLGLVFAGFPFLFSFLFLNNSNLFEFKFKFEFNSNTQTKIKPCTSMNAQTYLS